MNATISELREQLRNTREDRKRINLLAEMVRHLQRSDPPQALEYANEALALSHKLNDRHHVAHSLNSIGICYRLLSNNHAALSNCREAYKQFVDLKDEEGQASALYNIGIINRHLYHYEEAIEALNKSLEISDMLNNAHHSARILNSLGLVYRNLGDYLKAIDYLYRSLKIRETLADHANIGTLLNNLGNLYANIGEYHKALEYYEKSLELHENIQDPHAQAVTLRNIGESYFRLNHLDTALEYLEKSLDALQELDDKSVEASSLINIGEIHVKRNNLELAQGYLQRAMNLSLVVDNKRDYADANLHLGKIYSKRGDYRQSVTYLEEALLTSREIGDKNLESKVHFSLSGTYRFLNLPWEALEHFRAYADSHKEVQSQEAKRAIAEMQARFNVEKAENEKEIFRLKNVELTAALEKVESLNKHLLALNEEKNTLLGILAHDLRTPLTGIISSVSLIRKYFDKMSREEVFQHLDVINATADRINTIISNLLDVNAIESGKLTLHFESLDLVTLASIVVEDFLAQAHSKHITLEIQAETVAGKIYADQNALRNVLENLVSNAIKFSPAGKHILLHVYQRNGFIGCRVQDEGPGLTEEDKQHLFEKFARLSAKPTAGEQSTGLGLSIVKQLIDAMGGYIHCESMYGEGAAFMVEFPVQPDIHN